MKYMLLSFRLQRYLLALCACAVCATSFADTVLLAVASNFTRPMQALAREFELRTGHEVDLSFGSSGKIFAQIQHGAPFHAFFSADQSKPDQLMQTGFAIQSSQFTYAIGRLALWSSTGLTTSATLTQGPFGRLAIANPRLAPYGAAAVQTLQHLALDEQTRPHWVIGENIAQAYQFVHSGNAQIGFVALSQLSQEQVKQAWIVPYQMHKPIKQNAVLLNRGADHAPTQAFLAFTRSNAGRDMIETFGYATGCDNT